MSTPHHHRFPPPPSLHPAATSLRRRFLSEHLNDRDPFFVVQVFVDAYFIADVVRGSAHRGVHAASAKGDSPLTLGLRRR